MCSEDTFCFESSQKLKIFDIILQFKDIFSWNIFVAILRIYHGIYQHTLFAWCQDKGQGSYPCILNALTTDQAARLAIPSNKLNKKKYDRKTASLSSQVDPSNVLVLGHRDSELPTPENSPRCHEKCFPKKKESNPTNNRLVVLLQWRYWFWHYDAAPVPTKHLSTTHNLKEEGELSNQEASPVTEDIDQQYSEKTVRAVRSFMVF